MGSPPRKTAPSLHTLSRNVPQQGDKPKPPLPKAGKMTFRRQIRPAPCSGPAALPSPNANSSSPRPLPKSHIHRTPSEIQLADEVRRAEYDDVRMYARLVVGMQGQIQRGCHSGGAVHPLSKKSLQGVVRTKQADDAALEKLDGLHGANEDDDSESPWSTLAQRPPWSKSESDGSLSTRGSLRAEEDGGEELDCVFSLEL